MAVTYQGGVGSGPVVDLDFSAIHYSAATLHEAADRTGNLPAAITPVHPHFRISGPAFPVRCPTGHNLQIHQALVRAQPADILVVDVGVGEEFGYWGEILSEAAKARDLGGVVLSGCARDRTEIGVVDFPVFAAGICLRGTGKAVGGGSVGETVRIGAVDIAAGDLVVGDIDGVVCLPRGAVPAVLVSAQARTVKENEIIRRLRTGSTTLELYDFPGLAP